MSARSTKTTRKAGRVLFFVDPEGDIHVAKDSTKFVDAFKFYVTMGALYHIIDKRKNLRYRLRSGSCQQRGCFKYF